MQASNHRLGQFGNLAAPGAVIMPDGQGLCADSAALAFKNDNLAAPWALIMPDGQGMGAEGAGWARFWRSKMAIWQHLGR